MWEMEEGARPLKVSGAGRAISAGEAVRVRSARGGKTRPSCPCACCFPLLDQAAVVIFQGTYRPR